MARSRNIKPGFFENEDLADCGPYAMLLFAGLWTLADRAGRLEDRPRRIKAQLLPYFDVDVDDELCKLEEGGFVTRYMALDGQRYIQIVNFTRHQNPHIKEAPSTIPAPDTHEESPEETAEENVSVRLVTLEKCDDDNTSQEHRASTVQESLMPDSSLLIPDSGFPSTPIPPQRGGVRVQYPPEFEEFWRDVVRKEPSKSKALDCWRRALRRSTAEEPVTPEIILAGLRRFLPVWEVTEPHLIPHITTWLNQDRWTATPTMPSAARASPNGKPPTIADEFAALRAKRATPAPDPAIETTWRTR